MLITTSKILPLLTKLFFQTGSSKQKFSYTDCLLLSALFKRNLIRFYYILRLSQYFLIIRDENVTFKIEVRRGTKCWMRNILEAVWRMDMWVACRLLNASFIFNGIEYAKLRLYLCFYKFDLFAGRRFWTLFFPKKYTSAYTWIDSYASIYGNVSS